MFMRAPTVHVPVIRVLHVRCTSRSPTRYPVKSVNIMCMSVHHVHLLFCAYPGRRYINFLRVLYMLVQVLLQRAQSTSIKRQRQSGRPVVAVTAAATASIGVAHNFA